MPEPSSPRRGGAIAVAAGIFLSRIAGLVRERAIGHYLGVSDAVDAFRAALRIPNLLQNLLGEGVLSASFIPVYARLLAEGHTEEAGRVARVIGTLLALVASAIAVVGVLAADPLVDILAPGFEPSRRALTVLLVQLMFPGTALLVLSAWCLGVLNSHRRFFLAYVAPVLWNTAIIAATVAAGRRFATPAGDADIARWLAYGALIGAAAQFLVQLPSVLRLLRGWTPSVAVREPGVRAALRAFVPVLIGRGSVQLSAYVDQIIASYLAAGMVGAIGYAQVLYLLPVSLFGMAISAAELPEMASGLGSADERAGQVRSRLGPALRRVAFFVVPSAVAFAAIGSSLVALVFGGGRFDADAADTVWLILLGASIGLIPNTLGRLLSSALYALGDAVAPLRAALVRIALGTALGAGAVFALRTTGETGARAALALTAAGGLAAWVELAALRAALRARIGSVPLPWRLIAGALAAASVAGAVAYASIELVGLPHASWRAGLLAAPVFGAVYLAAMAVARVPEAAAFVRRVRRRRG